MATGKTAQGGKNNIRGLKESDLDAVVVIDTGNTGRARRGFFEKRLAAVKRDPDLFLSLAIEDDKGFAGFVIARIFRGEFGTSEPVASIDAFGIGEGRQGHGLGRALMSALEAALRKRDILEIRSQDSWTGGALMGFFAATGFELAPIWVLDRTLDGPVDF
ncbi:MAG: GNAT family N-acetyltransferase [Alphaproteobacteria bacterium]